LRSEIALIDIYPNERDFPGSIRFRAVKMHEMTGKNS
jgi:hypothetical protein